MILRIKQIIRNLYYSDTEKNFWTMMYFLKVNKIKGNYAEFGVDKGEKLIMAYDFAQKQNHTEMRFYGFDSFEGFPEPSNDEKGMSWKKGDYACSLEQVKDNLRKNNGFFPNKIFLIKGYYKETLKDNHNIKKLAAIHIDCSLYNSTKMAFKYIKPLLQDGTVILINSWFTFKANPNYGEQRAFLEFAKENPQFSFTEIPCNTLGKMFVVNKKQNED